MYKVFGINSMLVSKNNWCSLILLLTSFGLLIPGIFLPMLSMSAQYGGKELFSYRQSISQAIETLWNGGNYLVAFLIALFSIAIPLLKGFLMLWVFFLGNYNFKYKAHSFVFAKLALFLCRGAAGFGSTAEWSSAGSSGALRLLQR